MARYNFTIFDTVGNVTVLSLDELQTATLQTVCIRHDLEHWIAEVGEPANAIFTNGVCTKCGHRQSEHQYHDGCHHSAGDICGCGYIADPLSLDEQDLLRQYLAESGKSNNWA